MQALHRLARMLALVLALGLAPTGGPLWAQGVTAPDGSASGAALPAYPILLLNQERLLSASLYGQRIQREVDVAGSALAAENRRIEAELTEEELRLTERRGQLSPEAFRPLAQEFNTRVEGIRAAQEAKTRALQEQAEGAQVAFFETAFPILIDLLRLRGAGVLMDSRAVLLSADNVDITDEAIARIDEALGQGGPEPLIDLDAASPSPAP